MSANDYPRERVFTRQTGPGELTKVIIEYLQFSEVHIGEEFWAADEFLKYTKTADDEATIFGRNGEPCFLKYYSKDEVAIVITKEVVK